MTDFYYCLLIYFGAVSLITAIVTIADKILARMNKRRVSEATLFTFAIIGGALSEYVIMKIIRHKTLHKKFMIGLPIIFILQAVCLCAVLYFL